MFRKPTSAYAPSSWRVLLSVLCVALVLLAGTVSVTHTHAPGDISHADCGLCATAHAVVQVAAAPAPVAIAQVVERVEPSLPSLRPRATFQFERFTRPPPANAARS